MVFDRAAFFPQNCSISILNNFLISGSLGGKRINHMLYADDLCIVSLSSAGLPKLLSICGEY